MRKIDNTEQPTIPYDSWTIEIHDTSLRKIDPSKISLYVSPEQKTGYVEGIELQKQLKGKKPLNATVLDWLIEHPEYIPDEWKGKYVFFWGTIYRDSDGSLCVRCLCFSGGHWRQNYDWLDRGWDADGPSAVAASPLDSDTHPSLETLPLALSDIPQNINAAIEMLKKEGFTITKTF